MKKIIFAILTTIFVINIASAALTEYAEPDIDSISRKLVTQKYQVADPEAFIRSLGVTASMGEKISAVLENSVADIGAIGDKIRFSFANIVHWASFGTKGTKMMNISYVSLKQRYHLIAINEDTIGGVWGMFSYKLGTKEESFIERWKKEEENKLKRQEEEREAKLERLMNLGAKEKQNIIYKYCMNTFKRSSQKVCKCTAELFVKNASEVEMRVVMLQELGETGFLINAMTPWLESHMICDSKYNY